MSEYKALGSGPAHSGLSMSISYDENYSQGLVQDLAHTVGARFWLRDEPVSFDTDNRLYESQ